MREILFRGKAINRDKGYRRTEYKNGDWVYGLLTRPYDERFENLPAEMTDTSGISGIEVDYKSIGQFTGLADKNGKKIFEGDIVTVPLSWDGDDVMDVGRVFYSERSCGFYRTSKVFGGVFGVASGLSGIGADEYEVIGNIYDNPELEVTND